MSQFAHSARKDLVDYWANEESRCSRPPTIPVRVLRVEAVQPSATSQTWPGGCHPYSPRDAEQAQLALMRDSLSPRAPITEYESTRRSDGRKSYDQSPIESKPQCDQEVPHNLAACFAPIVFSRAHRGWHYCSHHPTEEPLSPVRNTRLHDPDLPSRGRSSPSFRGTPAVCRRRRIARQGQVLDNRTSELHPDLTR